MQAVVKPVVEVKPGQDVIHNTPEGPHVDHVAPTNLGHVHLQPLRPSFVHLRPGHVDQVHQVNVPHGKSKNCFHIQLIFEFIFSNEDQSGKTVICGR